MGDEFSLAVLLMSRTVCDHIQQSSGSLNLNATALRRQRLLILFNNHLLAPGVKVCLATFVEPKEAANAINDCMAS